MRQGSKEGPLLFNVTFRLILEETFSPLEDCAVRMTRKTVSSIISETGEPDVAINKNRLKATKRLYSKLSTIALRVKESIRLNALQDTARRMILGVAIKKRAEVDEQRKKMKNERFSRGGSTSGKPFRKMMGA